ncbi:hypothetical protein C8R46DRAFT_1044848 [Mycena filopes]|nr:hypothetical protein C8R46DRAFT_1044848 [Mycena filopes]
MSGYHRSPFQLEGPELPDSFHYVHHASNTPLIFRGDFDMRGRRQTQPILGPLHGYASPAAGRGGPAVGQTTASHPVHPFLYDAYGERSATSCLPAQASVAFPHPPPDFMKPIWSTKVLPTVRVTPEPLNDHVTALLRKLHESVEENARNQRTQFQEILHQLADLQARAGSGSLNRRVPEPTVPGLNALFRIPGKLAELRSTMDEIQVSSVPHADFAHWNFDSAAADISTRPGIVDEDCAQLVSWHWDLDSTAADISTRPGIVDEDSAQLESEHSTEFGQLFPSSDADAGLGGISVAIEALDYSEPLCSALIEVLPMDDTPSSTSFADPTVFPLATDAGASSRPPAKPQRRARKSKISPIGYPSPRRSVRLAAAVAGTNGEKKGGARWGLTSGCDCVASDVFFEPRGLLLSSAERELGSGVVITQLVYNICIFILWISRKQNMGYFTAVFQKAAFDPHQRTPSTQPRRPLGSSGIGDFNGRVRE